MGRNLPEGGVALGIDCYQSDYYCNFAVFNGEILAFVWQCCKLFGKFTNFAIFMVIYTFFLL